MLQQGDYRAAYRAQCAVLLEGPLDVELLRAALRNVVARHEILRTVFRRLPRSPIPVQVIAEHSTPADLGPVVSDLISDARDRDPAVLFQAALQVRFDFEHGPLLHTALIPLAPASALLLICLPALCADTLTLGNLAREIGRSYAALLRGQECADQPLQYADLSEWQNELFETEDLESRSAYWHKQHFAPLLGLRLPFQAESAERSPFCPQIASASMPAVLGAQIASVAQRLGTVPSVFFLACWSVLIWRLMGQARFVVGVGCSGRSYEELNEALGLFAKFLPIIIDLREDLPFGTLLAQLHWQLQGAQKWQEFFSWDQEELAGDPGLRFFPLCFDFEQYPARCSFGDVAFSIDRQYACADRFAVKLVCVQRERDFATEFHFDAACFPADAVARMVENYRVVLESAASAPDSAIGDVTVLSAAERRQVLFDFPSTRAAYPCDQYAHELIAAQACARPDALALADGTAQLSYAALLARAHQLANLLQTHGVGPEVVVALALPRSLDLVVALLGVLTSGGAALPLDLAAPPARQTQILSESGAPLLLTKSTLADTLPATLLPPLCLDQLADELVAQLSSAPATTVVPEQLAYVIYTSGSTGAPKGVAVPQRGLANLLAVQAAAFRLTSASRVLQFAPLSVDAGLAEVLVTLGAGATLVLDTSAALHALLERAQITTVTLPPTVLGLLAPDGLPRLRTLVAAGEASRAELVARWADGRRLVNAYGPTEASVCATLGECAPGEPVTIGRPIAGSVAYVLDEKLRPLPIGVVGELYLGGVGLARGYLGRPELTAERFIPNPFGTLNDERRTMNGQTMLAAPFSVQRSAFRLYKTGDLARWLADGRLEYAGRRDTQVKVRGFRVELGEVEAALCCHPRVQAGVVVARTVAADVRLVAYVVPTNDQRPTTNDESAPSSFVLRPSSVVNELRSFLKERLPSYMLPAAIIPLGAMPRTPSGKIDRRALPDVRGVRTDPEESYVAPQTELERAIGALWQELLQVEKVGIYDNFFDLGGHSLLMVMLQSKIQERFNRELSIAEMFTYPTVHGLSQYIGGAPGDDPAARDLLTARRIERAEAHSASRAEQRQLRQTQWVVQQTVGERDDGY